MIHPDQAWCADITCIRLANGFAHLAVILDWHSQYVLPWKFGTTLDKGFYLEALRRARRPWFDMGPDRDFRSWANGEDVFSGIFPKMAFGGEKDQVENLIPRIRA